RRPPGRPARRPPPASTRTGRRAPALTTSAAYRGIRGPMATTRALPWARIRAGCLAGHHCADRIRGLLDHRRKDAGVKASDKIGRAAEWSKKKYAGSVAENLWRRLDAMEVINQGMLFAATLLLCLFPFLIVASALAGRPLVSTLARYTGLNS